MKQSIQSALAGVALLIVASVPMSAPQAATPENQADARELVVGTKEAPPFAIKDEKATGAASASIFGGRSLRGSSCDIASSM